MLRRKFKDRLLSLSLRAKAVMTVAGAIVVLSLTSGAMALRMMGQESESTPASQQELALRWIEKLAATVQEGNLSTAEFESALEGVVALEGIVSVEIQDRDGRTVALANASPLASSKARSAQSSSPSRSSHLLSLRRKLSSSKESNSGSSIRSPTGEWVLLNYDDSTAAASLTVAQRNIWMLVAGACVVSIVLAWLATQSLMNPLYRLIEVSKAVASGNYQVSVPTRGHDELNALSRSFNSMAHEIHEAHSALEDQNQILEYQVDQRKKELHHAYEELTVIDRMKEELLAIVSRGFDEPLENMRGACSELASDSSFNQKQAQLELLLRESNALNSILEDALDCVQIDSGRVSSNQEQIRPEHILQNVVDILTGRCQEREVGIDFTSLQGPQPYVHWDSAKVTAVLRYLLACVVRSARKGETIPVSLDNHADPVRVTLGLNDETRPPCLTAPDSLHADRPGTTLEKINLGIPMSRQVLAGHSGRLFADSAEDGSCFFTVELPRRPAEVVN